MNKTGLAASTFAIALLGCMGTPDDADQGSADVQVERIERTATGTPYFMSGELGRIAGDLRAPATFAAAMPEVAKTLGVSGSELRVTRVEHDDLGMTHVRVGQYKNGLRVVSGDAILHLDDDGVIRSVDSGLADRDLPAAPVIDATAATDLAVQDTGSTRSDIGQVAAEQGELVYIVSNRDHQLYLAWRIKVTGFSAGLPVRDDVFVDAVAGTVVDRHPKIFTAKNRTIKNGNNGVFPVAGAPTVGTEATPPTEATALAAFTNTGLTYDCYKTLYNRDSYDGAGAPLTSQVHVVFDYGNGQTSPDNAMWSPDDRMMAYGDGDGTNMSPLAYSFDVTAHELTHAVTSSTADLVYQNESGALNESMSDIMGAVCQAWKEQSVKPATWLVGEDIWTPNTPGDALRYMDNPTKDGYSPDNYAELYRGTDDNGGVHGNSGIPNLAFYLLSQGGQHPRGKTNVKVVGVGIDKAGAIFQRALTTKMTPNTNMAQARTAIEQAAAELYPATCAKMSAGLAFAAVGVGTAPVDAAAPTVAVASPANGASVAPGFRIDVTTADDQCISKVEVLIDGVVAKTLDQAPYSFTFDGALAAGSHQLEVRSSDASNTSTATSTFTLTSASTGGNGTGTGGGDGTNGAPADVIGGCSTGGTGGLGGLLVVGLGLALGRRRRA